MAIPTIPDVGTTGGVKTVQDLYDLMAGKTTTASGGTATQNVTGGIDQAGMNAMLKSALESSSGLAQVSQGQRTAGGYGSSVNTMLTNDLLSRTAGQIAASNINKTTTTVTPQTTSTAGGVTAQGLGTSAGFLSALTAMNQTGASAWLKKNVFNSGTSVDATSNGVVGAGAAANPMNMDPQQTQAQSSGIDATQFINAQVDNSGSPASTIDFVGAPNIQESGNVAIPDFVAPQAPEPTFTAPTGTDLIDEYADGGMVNATGIKSYADGGPVTKKVSVLGTSQFNSVVDPRQGLAGSGSGVNAQGDPTVTATPTQTGVSANFGGSGGGGMINTGMGESSRVNADNIMSETPTQNDMQGLSAGLGVVGRLLNNPTLTNAGTLGQIASANNPVQAAAETGLNVATGGVYGKVKNIANTVMNPTLPGVVNTLAAMNPTSALLNGILGMFDAANIGEIAQNAKEMISPNQMMTPEQQGIAADYKADTNVSGGSSHAAPDGGGDRGPGGSSGESGAAAGGATASGPGGYNNGGAVDGPGTGVSDSIHAMLSDGEFVLSKDVVDAIGVHNLQALQDKYHTPAAVQKLKSFSR